MTCPRGRKTVNGRTDFLSHCRVSVDIVRGRAGTKFSRKVYRATIKMMAKQNVEWIERCDRAEAERPKTSEKTDFDDESGRREFTTRHAKIRVTYSESYEKQLV